MNSRLLNQNPALSSNTNSSPFAHPLPPNFFHFIFLLRVQPQPLSSPSIYYPQRACLHLPPKKHFQIQGRCHVVLVASTADLSSLQSACEDHVTLHKLSRSDVHVHTLILADPPGVARREEAREISRLLQQVERQQPHNVQSDKDLSGLFYSLLHAAITALLQVCNRARAAHAIT